MAASNEIIETLYQAPKKLLSKVKLVYVDERKLSISREREGKKFVYIYRRNPLTDEQQLERIKKLVIPPAWNNVQITHLPNGHLQAVGRDSKNRKQYRYHQHWSKIRNETKFYRMADFGKRLPYIRKRVEENLNLNGWPKEKVIALVIALMDETYMRIGNDQYARTNNTYGLTTLRKRHLDDDYRKLRFVYTGKRGKKHKVTLRNKKLVRLVRQCEELPGWELFQFYDENGAKQQIESGMVNEFLQDELAIDCTAKDFRTWGASVVFFGKLTEFEKTDDSAKREKHILRAYDAAANALGNTRNVCRKYYVHPQIKNTYLNEGSLPRKAKKNSSHFSATEQKVLDLIKDYQPEIIQSN